MTTRIPITCEARLMGLSKTRRKDGDWVEAKFHIHPDDHPAALFILPLGTACNLEISGADETAPDDAAEPQETHTDPEPARVKGGARAKRAGILCNDKRFQRWCVGDLGMNYNSLLSTAEALRMKCGISSRAELDHNEAAGQIWDRIESDFHASQSGETLEAREQQLRSGPG